MCKLELQNFRTWFLYWKWQRLAPELRVGLTILCF